MKKEVKIKFRKPCCYCVMKHLSQALILLQESILGYPRHVWLALGHMAEAESEILEYSEELAKKIRDVRICIQDQKPQKCSVQDLIWQVEEFMHSIPEKEYGKNPLIKQNGSIISNQQGKKI